ncbi:putative tyrosinase-like protein tyr-3 [Bulinus truncatus]|nr:putative tyrosinase-like protein tyr-3 [Bulinus truncatus]
MNSGVALLILTLINCLHFTNGKIKQIPIPDELQQCYNLVRETGVDEYVGSLYSWFCEHLIRNSSYVNGTVHINNATAKYYKEILDSVYWNDSSKHRSKRQALPPCVRKEYRMLTLDERRRYHNAVNALKRDTALPPNTHDAFGNVHTGQTNNIAHGGPGFLGWHRIFLYLYESNLRRMDPTVCLPYWDSTLDSQLPIPSLSSLWTADYLGTARGPLVSGPFAGWRFPNGAQIIRNVGVDGQLIYLSQIQNVLSRNR